ncbi:hypothetical protein HHK36_008931 [Tetracentron sinense]|uniref:Transcriptional coactivator p15 (PC4) C-terminal domain-containing protein n=1 Tax=Tetracentron sinense TaxID=13715 RepID=A0A834ZAW6_TETSI|nr:hypothetical protein HHK36_008931 [Tetracentron sinense]
MVLRLPRKTSRKIPTTPTTSSSARPLLNLFEISKNRRVSVRNWQGRVFVDIREFYVKDGKELPGKKGISLSMDQWNVLRDHVGEIDEAVAENA